ncbi:hypothetical protein [Sphingobium lactosutens]|nr:hypothetical protein [Sphingobium lactosutens]
MMMTDLRHDHDGLRRMMQDFALMMRSAGPEDMPEVTQRRIAFSQAFREHMAREDRMVQQLRKGLLSPEAAQVLREHGRAIVALFLRYSDHIKIWTPAQIEADWVGYRTAVLGLQDGLRERMAWEEQHLHPLMTPQTRIAA